MHVYTCKQKSVYVYKTRTSHVLQGSVVVILSNFLEQLIWQSEEEQDMSVSNS